MALNPFLAAADILDPPQAGLDPYVDDPVGWVQERLGEHVWSKQAEIMRSVRDNRRTAVPSCHSAGKSFVAARIAAWWIETHPPGEAFVVTSAPTGPQVKAILWKEIGRAHAHGGLVGRTNQTEWWLKPPHSKEELVAYGRKPADYDEAAFQGIHARYVLVILDEACGMPTNLFDAGDTLISNENSRMLAIGNPDDPVTEFADVCKPGSGWGVIPISVFDTPNFTGEEVPGHISELLVSPLWQEEKLKKWGEDNPMYIAKVLGQFPERTAGGLISIKWIKEAQERELPPTRPVELGVDVGGGIDHNVIACRRGPVVRVISRDHDPDTMHSLGRVMEAIRETKATDAKVDAVGIGAGMCDRANEIAKDKAETAQIRARASTITPVKVGMAAVESEDYRNLRAEGYWNLRERFREGNIDIDADDEDLVAQLVDLRSVPNSTGRLQIESKEQMRKRGKASPDEADAVMLAFLDPGAAPIEVELTFGRGRNRR